MVPFVIHLKERSISMTHEEKSNAWVSVLQPLIENGLDGLGEMLSAAVNFAMDLERERHLGAAAYERTPSRRGHANGFKPKGLHTRVGELLLRIPQVRDSPGPFRPSALERGRLRIFICRSGGGCGWRVSSPMRNPSCASYR
jgi:transposase-like protein